MFMSPPPSESSQKSYRRVAVLTRSPEQGGQRKGDDGAETRNCLDEAKTVEKFEKGEGRD